MHESIAIPNIQIIKFMTKEFYFYNTLSLGQFLECLRHMPWDWVNRVPNPKISESKFTYQIRRPQEFGLLLVLVLYQVWVRVSKDPTPRGPELENI